MVTLGFVFAAACWGFFLWRYFTGRVDRGEYDQM